MTLDEMANELRRVMAILAHDAAKTASENQTHASVASMVSVFNFAAYGFTCGLISLHECNDWKAVSQWKETLPVVMERWGVRYERA